MFDGAACRTGRLEPKKNSAKIEGRRYTSGGLMIIMMMMIGEMIIVNINIIR